MKFRKMVTVTLYVRQQKRHRCIEQSFGHWEKAMVGWSERIALKHVYYHMWNRSPVQFSAWDRVLRAGALGWPWGIGWGGRWEGVSGWGTHVHPWLIHINVWQKPLQYCEVFQFSSVAQSCLSLCNPMNCTMPGLPVHHQCPEFTQTHVHRVGNAIQPSHPLSSPSPPAPNPSQHQSLFPMSQLFAWGGQSTGVSALALVLPRKSQGWSPSEWTGWIFLQARGLSRFFSNTTIEKHQFFGTQLSSQSN